jgi:hypothetical protein
MAQYTLTIREILENNVKIFDFDYPIFDEAYRTTLEENITNAFYFREIGQETVGKFKWYLKAKMKLIMPYYNQLYRSTLYEVDPLSPYHVTESYTRSTTGSGSVSIKEDQTVNNTVHEEGTTTGSGTTSGSESDKELFSDTPQGRVSLDADGSNNTYITSIKQNSNSNTGSTTSTGNNTADTTNDTTTGKTGTNTTNDTGNETFSRSMTGHIGVQTYSDLINSWRTTFINIDQKIIDELNELFMGVY